MRYLTHVLLAEIPGALELAQVATDEQRMPVQTELMDLSLRGGDRSAFATDEIAHADAALARIDTAVAEAEGMVDGYLARRYTLPLAKVHPLLVTWARAIARYKLHGSRVSDERTDPIARDYRDSLKLLQQVAEGKFSLGIGDPTTGSTALGDFVFDPGHKVFGRRHLP